jgi:hypothetical protein
LVHNFSFLLLLTTNGSFGCRKTLFQRVYPLKLPTLPNCQNPLALFINGDHTPSNPPQTHPLARANSAKFFFHSLQNPNPLQKAQERVRIQREEASIGGLRQGQARGLHPDPWPQEGRYTEALPAPSPGRPVPEGLDGLGGGRQNLEARPPGRYRRFVEPVGWPVRQEEFPGSNKGNAENTLSISYSVVQLFWVVLRILAGSCKILPYLVIVSLVEVMWEVWTMEQ